MKKIKTIKNKTEDHLLLEAVESSSVDRDQSIYKTVFRDLKDQFWNSSGTEQSDVNDYLLFKVADKGVAFIHSVVLSLH